MTPSRWQQIERIYHAALEREPDRRGAFLAEVCSGDEALRQEVESLLAQEVSSTIKDGAVKDPLARPAWEGAAGLFDPSGAHFTAGAKIGSYVIEAQLGEGGMGVVYRGRDTRLNRPVAIKFLSTQLADISARRRFQREAQLASALNHPHIVTVYDVGEFEGRQYLVTEFVDSGTLKTWARAHKRDWLQAVELLTGVAEGLAAAHSAGILHRDIKPDNILVSKNAYAKLADFGLAKLAERIDGHAASTLTQGRTGPGMIFGTIAYMSPEQASGKPLDARSDIFSLGVVLYEMLAGRRPFVGSTDMEVLQTVIHGTPRPLGDDLPVALRSVVEKALEKNPANRYQSMQEMVVDLRRLARQSTETPAPFAGTSRKRSWMWIAAIVFVLLIAATTWKLLPRADAAPVRSIAVLPLANLSGDPSQEYFSDGTTEALISSLAQIHSLDVISRTSVMRYKGTTKTAREIGKETGADAIVEGSLQRSGNRVRIAVQLIRTATDKHIWANNYDRDLSDVLKLESEVAQSIAQQILVEVTPEESGRLRNARSVIPEARDEYLLGRYNVGKNSDESAASAITHFQRAIQLEPDFADAYAGLADAWGERVLLGYPKQKEALEASRAAAMKALDINPNLPGPHLALGWNLILSWDWAAAGEHFQRAVFLDHSAETDRGYTTYLEAIGRIREATELADRLAKADPLSSTNQFAAGLAYYIAHRFAEAVPLCERALELNPQDRTSRIVLSQTYARLGRTKEAVALLDRPGFRADWPMGVVYALTGRQAEASQIAGNITKPGSHPDPRGVANIYFALGDKDRGLAWLTRAVDGHHPLVYALKVDPPYDDVRSDPRFQALVARMKLP